MAGQTSSTKFQPGQSGNPKGPPKRDWTVAGLIEQAMEEESETGVPHKKIVYDKLVSLAVSGDMLAIKEVKNRLEGMPEKKNVHAGDEENPIKIDVNIMLDKVYGTDKSKGT